MASSKEYKNYVLEQLSLLDDITCRVVFGGIYDDRFLIKKTISSNKYGMLEEIPYKGAKSMYQIDNIEDKESLRKVVVDTYKELKQYKYFPGNNLLGNINVSRETLAENISREII